MMTRVHGLLAAIAMAGLSACATAPADRSALIAPYTTQPAQGAEAPRYPYTALHQRRGQTLAFVAADHTLDPASPTMEAIRAAFAEVRPAAVIVEGFPSEWGENPQAIHEMISAAPGSDPSSYARGEAGYTLRLAVDSGIPFLGGEPTEAEQTRALIAQGFSSRDVFFTDLLKLLPQSIREGEITGPADPGFYPVFGRWTVSLAIERDDPPKITLEEFEQWYLDQFGVDYRVDAHFSGRADPGADTLTGRILRAQSLLRDRHLYGTILRTLKTHDRVLVVYGGTHHTALAGALNASLGPARKRPAGPRTLAAGAGAGAGAAGN